MIDLDKDFKNNPYAVAYFIIDDYRVTIKNTIISNRLKKVIYVDGWLVGEWMIDYECDQSQRFALVKTEYAYSAKWRKTLLELAKIKGTSKEEKAAYKADANQKKERRYFYFTGAIKTLLKQWKERAINKSIELVDADGNVIHKFK